MPRKDIASLPWTSLTPWEQVRLLIREERAAARIAQLKTRLSSRAIFKMRVGAAPGSRALKPYLKALAVQ